MRVHVLYHAAQEPFYGAAMMEELRRHGYTISPGTFYPMLHRLEDRGLLNRKERVVDGKVRKYYAATADGRAVLDEIRPKLRELIDEMLKEKAETRFRIRPTRTADPAPRHRLHGPSLVQPPTYAMSNSPAHMSPKAAWWTLPLVRLMVGAVFFSEGIQKFLYPAMRGPGRFAEMGWPVPGLLANVVGAAEIVCGTLILLGLYTRLAAAGTATIMTVAIITTKIPIWMGTGFGPFEVRELSQYGFWSMAHAMRTDWAMLLGSVVLAYAGGGPWSVGKGKPQEQCGTGVDPL